MTGASGFGRRCSVVAKVKDHLGSMIENGKLANAQLKQLAERPKRFGVI